MNKETLEEAAEEYSKRHQDVSGTLGKYLVSAVFQDGANWQAERMYSEEKVIDILYSFHKEENSRVVFSLSGITKWFEQFKKK